MTLHGILAVTAPYLSIEALASRAYFPTGTSRNERLHPETDFDNAFGGATQPSGMLSFNSKVSGTGTPRSRFQMWHRRKCVEGHSAHLSSGVALLESMYATAMVSFMDYSNGWFVDMWMESCSGARLGMGLNLNLSSSRSRVGSSDPTVNNNDTLERNIGNLLGPPKTAIEQAERDRLWWMAFLMEKLVCCGMTWPHLVVDDEITVELPVNQAIYEEGRDNLIGVQTLSSPDFYGNRTFR